MIRFAIIENNRVVNMAAAEEEFAYSQGWVLAPDDADIGDVYSDGVFTKYTPATPEEVSEIERQRQEQLKQQRSEAYRTESDPLFFKSQRGEATQQEWLDKVAEIKARYV